MFDVYIWPRHTNQRKVARGRRGSSAPSCLELSGISTFSQYSSFILHSDFEDDDVFTFETCITVNEKLINVAPLYFGKQGESSL